MDNAEVVFDKKTTSNNKEDEKSKLFNKIGKQQVEIDFLKEVLGK